MSAIFRTYAFVLACGGWFVGVVYFIFARQSAYLDNQVGIWLAFVGFAAAMFVPYGLLLLMRAVQARRK